MGLFKEQVYQLQALANKQVRLYQDACDEGIIIKNFDCSAVKEIKEILEFLPSDMKKRTEHRQHTEIYVKWELSFTWEVGNVEKWTIHFIDLGKKKLKYIQIYK